MTEDPTPDPKPAKRRFRDVALPLRILVGVAFATIVTLTIAQVFFRFVLNSPLVWSEEVDPPPLNRSILIVRNWKEDRYGEEGTQARRYCFEAASG